LCWAKRFLPTVSSVEVGIWEKVYLFVTNSTSWSEFFLQSCPPHNPADVPGLLHEPELWTCPSRSVLEARALADIWLESANWHIQARPGICLSHQFPTTPRIVSNCQNLRVSEPLEAQSRFCHDQRMRGSAQTAAGSTGDAQLSGERLFANLYLLSNSSTSFCFKHISVSWWASTICRKCSILWAKSCSIFENCLSTLFQDATPKTRLIQFLRKCLIALAQARARSTNKL